ncbi:MAG: YqiJ family protein [Kangiellaceae bacterium]|nr:YqiJ family protein [Kangiellaceae bacterium]
MDQFLLNISSFPTAIFTTVNVVIIGIWFIIALGLIDMEVFDLSIDIDVDTDPTSLSGIASFLVTLGLSGVPIFIVLTIIFFVSWIISYIAVKYGLFWNNFDSIRYIVGLVILVVSFLASIPITAQFIKPLRKLFSKLNSGSTTSQSLLGKQCVVRTTKVNKSFGEAECTNQGASLILKIRASESYQLKNGDLVRIIEFDQESSAYQVIPENEFSINIT